MTKDEATKITECFRAALLLGNPSEDALSRLSRLVRDIAKVCDVPATFIRNCEDSTHLGGTKRVRRWMEIDWSDSIGREVIRHKLEEAGTQVPVKT